MKLLRKAAWAVLIVIALMSLGADIIAPSGGSEQFRTMPQEAPSKRFPLGTDDLGRDRWARLWHGARISLTLAPGAALFSILVAGLTGCAVGFLSGWPERIALRALDLLLSLPWLFLLLTARALLPLNTAPETSIVITFTLLALIGWAAPARVVRSGIRQFLESDFTLQARALGISPFRFLWRHLLPNLLPILRAQFLMLLPYFLLGEANLGMLGLGVSEPLPSWGNQLRGLESVASIQSQPWLLAPAVLLVLVLCSLEIVTREEELLS